MAKTVFVEKKIAEEPEATKPGLRGPMRGYLPPLRVEARLRAMRLAVDEGLDFFERLSGIEIERPNLAVYCAPVGGQVGTYSNGNTFGLYYQDIATVALNFNTPAAYARVVSLHELGHHIDFVLTGPEAFDSNPAIREGKADLFSSCVMFGHAGVDAIKYMIGHFQAWRGHMDYTLEHYNFLAGRVRPGKAGEATGEEVEGRTEVHNLGSRLITMYCIAGGTSINNILVSAMLSPSSILLQDLMAVMREDELSEIPRRIAAHPGLVVSARE